jgi:hypothetical protein
MNAVRSLVAVTLSCLMPAGAAQAAELAGRWSAEFETQVGPQKYTFEFSGEGASLQGKASYERMGETGEVELEDLEVTGDTISFVEPFSFQGTDLAITYSGKIEGDEIAFERRVGDFATEKLTARRAAE